MATDTAAQGGAWRDAMLVGIGGLLVFGLVWLSVDTEAQRIAKLLKRIQAAIDRHEARGVVAEMTNPCDLALMEGGYQRLDLAVMGDRIAGQLVNLGFSKSGQVQCDTIVSTNSARTKFKISLLYDGPRAGGLAVRGNLGLLRDAAGTWRVSRVELLEIRNELP